MPNAGTFAFLSSCVISRRAARRSPRLLAAALADVERVVAQESFDRQPGTNTRLCSSGLPGLASVQTGCASPAQREEIGIPFGLSASRSPSFWTCFLSQDCACATAAYSRGSGRLCFSRALGTSKTSKLVFSTFLLLVRCNMRSSTIAVSNWDTMMAVRAQAVSHLSGVLLSAFFPWEMQKC